MSVARAKKKKPKKDPAANPHTWESRKITEAIRLVCAEAVWFGFNYYKFGPTRRQRIIDSFWDEMKVARVLGLDALSAAKRSNKLVDRDIVKECRVIADAYIREYYMMCISVMIIVLKKLKCSKKLLNTYIMCVLYQAKHDSAYDFIAAVADATGYNAARDIIWS